MARKAAKEKSRVARFPKSPTGISGLDEITGGGLPKGRPTLVVGSAGSGKTLFGMEFLVRGATEFHEPGVFVAFEETPAELMQNVNWGPIQHRTCAGRTGPPAAPVVRSMNAERGQTSHIETI